MTVRFRNLDFDPSLPIDEWPAEAIEMAIDRGWISRGDEGSFGSRP